MEIKEGYPLSTEQKIIACAPASMPQLVIAPPGAGKTHVVVGRILHLIQKEGLGVEELLVLCFTRTAVAEITRRLKDLVKDNRVIDDLRFLTIRTFDSFASRLLFATNPDEDLSGFDYDNRISEAIQSLDHENNIASQIVSAYRHIIVDEIQDVVGVRAKLVQVLIERISGSYTLLGDPAQAIYQFSSENNTSTNHAETVLEWVMKQPWSQGAVRELTENHRSSGILAEKIQSIRKVVLSGSDDDPDALERLQEFVSNLNQVGTGKLPELPVTAPGETLCVLCRSNGEVLQMASLFQLNDIQSNLKPRPEDKGLPAWIGRVFGTFTKTNISSREFTDRWDTLVGKNYPVESNHAWDWLKRIEGRDRVDLNLTTLHSQLCHGKTLPDDQDAYVQKESGGISIATIHSVKGREFDHVVVLSPDNGRNGGNTKEEARILYVAATRAKTELSSIGRAGLPRMWKVDCGSGKFRWIAHVSRFYFLELGLRDEVEKGSAVNRYIHADPESASATQEFLWAGLKSGDKVDINKAIGGRYAFFRISTQAENPTDSFLIGQMDRRFKWDLQYVLRGLSHRKDTALPSHLKNLSVTTVVTDLLPAYDKNYHEPFATSRFCLGVRLRGMGYIYQD